MSRPQIPWNSSDYGRTQFPYPGSFFVQTAVSPGSGVLYTFEIIMTPYRMKELEFKDYGMNPSREDISFHVYGDRHFSISDRNSAWEIGLIT